MSDGVSGLIKNPLRGAESGGFAGFAKGVGTGMLGLVVKPVVGVTDAATDVLQGGVTSFFVFVVIVVVFVFFVCSCCVACFFVCFFVCCSFRSFGVLSSVLVSVLSHVLVSVLLFRLRCTKVIVV